mgnify:CR=1 FL=1
MHDVKPTTAAEWATFCNHFGPLAGIGGPVALLCVDCADAYARQQVEAFREPLGKLWAGLEDALREGEGVEYDVLLDLCEQAGLVRQEPYDPEKHGSPTDNQEPGSPWYVTTEIAAAIRALDP